MHSIPHLCARRNWLLPRWVSLRKLPLLQPHGHLNLPPLPTGRHSGLAYRTPKGLPERISLSSRMGRCAVLPGGPCMRKSGGLSAMARCGCSTPRGSAIVARVRCASSVKNRRPPSKRGGSAPSIGLSLHRRQFQVSPHLPQRTLPLHWLLIRCVFRDWQRRSHRRELVKLLRHQHIDIGLTEPSPPVQSSSVRPLSRAERAHYRLSWKDRLARNARRSASPRCLDHALRDTRRLCHYSRSPHRLSVA
jgi:hypothetical protein